MCHAGEGRMMIESADQARTAKVRDIEDQRAAIDVAHVCAIWPFRIAKRVMWSEPVVVNRVTLRRGDRITLTLTWHPPAADLPGLCAILQVHDHVELVIARV